MESIKERSRGRRHMLPPSFSSPPFTLSQMDFDNVKAEKAMAMRRYTRLRIIGRFFRAAEVCIAILFISWTFSRLPFAIQISGEFLRNIAGVTSSPLFVFLLGNFIVVVLLTKSSDQTTDGGAETEIYQTFVRSVEKQSKTSEEIVTDLNSNSNLNDSDSVSDQQRNVYERSKSDVKMVIKRSLQRSETEKRRKEDKLSNEEFQKTIEAFIAKELKFRRQESLAVVVHNKAS